MKLEAKQRLQAKEPMDLHLDKGAFHRNIGEPEDKPITKSDIAKGKKSPSLKIRREAQFAENAKKWKHK